MHMMHGNSATSQSHLTNEKMLKVTGKIKANLQWYAADFLGTCFLHCVRKEDSNFFQMWPLIRQIKCSALWFIIVTRRAREQLKDKIRKQQCPATVLKDIQGKKSLPHDNYGSFFSTSEPGLAQRVIKERQSIIEAHQTAWAQSSPNSDFINEKKRKIQILKRNGDYSFLNFVDMPPIPNNKVEEQKPNPYHQKSLPNNDVNKRKSTDQVAEPTKAKTSSILDIRKRKQEKVRVLKKIRDYSILKSMGMRPQPSTKQKELPFKRQKAEEHKSSSQVVKPKPTDHVNKRKSNDKETKPTKKVKHVANLVKVLEDKIDISPMIKRMFIRNHHNYKFENIYDEDDAAMESNFHDIQKEERRSARIAREEDKIELKRMLEEEKQETEAKRQKMQLH
ncbi:Chromatin SPT2 [Dillenia turbinata]|uniref:Chromatin SPT2 n=1 Tax=Dillenia turbinata TaxID=194707 RepID=A0AAN8W404_9MAGN